MTFKRKSFVSIWDRLVNSLRKKDDNKEDRMKGFFQKWLKNLDL